MGSSGRSETRLLSHELEACAHGGTDRNFIAMLVAAGLFARTLSNLHSIELGFNRENLLLFQVDARKAGHKDPEILAFYRELRNQFSTIPGVLSATLENGSPIGGENGEPISLPGSAPNPANRYSIVGPAFFGTMQIPMVAGRDLRASDRLGSPSVAVINQVFAKLNFRNKNPLGQHLLLQEDGVTMRDMEIVGVSRNASYGSLTRAIPPVVYMPYDQGYLQPNQMVYALRTAGDPLAVINSVREVVHQADLSMPISQIRTQVADIDRTITQEIVFAQLCSGFAILALLIACVGLYDTVSYDVSRRTSEVGIRMALGAGRGTVMRMILCDVPVLTAVGLAVCISMTLATSKLIQSLLYGMKSTDPLALTLAIVTLLSAALIAGSVPAWKASRIDPMIAIRHE